MLFLCCGFVCSLFWLILSIHRQDTRLKNGKTTSSKRASLPIPPTFAREKLRKENLQTMDRAMLKSWLLEKFAKTAFNKDQVFQAMSGPDIHIHLKVPKAKHNPISVPLHFKEPVRQALWKDLERGIIAPVPVGMPTDWGSTIVITAKKTVDHQHLNSQYKRETHHPSWHCKCLLEQKKNKNNPRCCRQVPLDPLRQRIPTIDHLHYRVRKVHLS